MAWSPIFEVALTTDPANEPVAWTDLTSRVRIPDPLEISYGAGRLTGRGEGDLSLTLDNYDRLIDPTNAAAAPDVLMRHARLRATVGAATFDLFRGFVDAWHPALWAHDSQIAVRLVDGTAWLALQDADLDLPAQWSHERVTAILDAAGWPAGLRDIGPGRVHLQPLEQSSANMLRTLEDTADAEDGLLYVAPDGKITYQSRHHDFDAAPTIAFGDGGLPILDGNPAYDTSWLSNIGRVELADGDVYEAIDDASVVRHGKRVQPVRDLALRAREAQALGQWEVVRFAWPHIWSDGLQVDATEDADLAAVLAARVGDTATVALTPGEGDPLALTLGIDRIRHTIEPGLVLSTFDLAPWFGEGPWFTWDDPTKGWDMDAKWAP